MRCTSSSWRSPIPSTFGRCEKMLDSTQVKTLSDMFADMKPLVDPALFREGLKGLLDDWKLIGAPVDALTRTSEEFKAFQVPDC